jgi:hypothetical protein
VFRLGSELRLSADLPREDDGDDQLYGDHIMVCVWSLVSRWTEKVPKTKPQAAAYGPLRPRDGGCELFRSASRSTYRQRQRRC